MGWLFVIVWFLVGFVSALWGDCKENGKITYGNIIVDIFISWMGPVVTIVVFMFFGPSLSIPKWVTKTAFSCEKKQ